MKWILLSGYLAVAVRTVTYGVDLWRNRQKEASVGVFLMLAIAGSVMVLTFCIGHS